MYWWVDWVDWGIVIGTLGLVAILIVCLDIVYGESEKPEGETRGTPANHREKSDRDTKHAA